VTLIPETTWLACPKPKPNAALRLFCFPYAGGGSALFMNWPDLLPQSVEVCAARLPGRGARMKERPFTNLSEMVGTISETIAPFLNKPFAFFGHSMGAMISFELARRLRREGQPAPERLFVSGRRAPQLRCTDPPTYNLPDAEFIRELKTLNGTPPEVLMNEELVRLVMPLLRSDFQVCQTHEYTPEAPLACAITAMGGIEDEEAQEGRLDAWKEQTTSSFSLRIMPGDHFYLHKYESLFFRTLLSELADLDVRVK